MTKSTHQSQKASPAASVIPTLAQNLAQQNRLDTTAHDEATRLSAVLFALKKAGPAVRPQTRSAGRTLKALATMEDLAGLPEQSLQRVFLALRSLDLKAGEQIGGSLALDAKVRVFAEAGGIVLTDNEEETVAGVIGDLGARELSTIMARGRQAWPGSGPVGTGRALSKADFSISYGNNTLFTEQATGNTPDALLAAIDRLESRHSAITAAAARNGAQPLDYEVIEPSEEELDGDQLFTEYRPARLRIKGAAKHPSPLIESAALASTLPPLPEHRPLLDPKLVERGILSEAQLEAIVMAGQAHEGFLLSDPLDPNGTPPRQGFLLGDGTGVGKGRECAGIIADNWNRGRTRAIYVSENQRLIAEFTRDWVALGGRTGDIFPLSDVSAGKPIPARNGICYASFAMLRQADRLQQLVDWVGLTSDNVIVFDESQNARNAMTAKKGYEGKSRSQQGIGVIELQRLLPQARVVYASATSASDIPNMGYAIRLGLWGLGTAFATPKIFFDRMAEGGMNALELVARDLKALGLYGARNLSFKGVTYERLDCALTKEERETHDRLANLWTEVRHTLYAALRSTGLEPPARYAETRTGKKMTLGRFNMARARFFQASHAGIIAPHAIKAARDDISKGHQVIMQLTNTFEANMERAIAENDTGDFADVEAGPKDILIQYLRHRFPVVKQEYFKTVINGKFVLCARPKLDANNDPVLCSKAIKARDDLIDRVKAIPMPEGPLEQIIDAFGAENVAEVTGRSRRLLRDASGNRRLEERPAGASVSERDAFQRGLKKILVFSASGATGASYHADPLTGNTALRRHYLLQPGWRADQAIQALGRSHRAGQAQTPQYTLLMSDLWSNRRMISRIAAGMQKLGAITRGQRHAATQDLFTNEDNLESEHATEAWYRFLKDLEKNQVPNLSLAALEHETGIPLRAANGASLINKLPDLSRFLNAMAAMTCQHQEAFGNAYKARLDEVRLQAIANGTYDRGIETILPKSLIKLEEHVIYREPKTGAETKLLKMLRVDDIDPTTFKEAHNFARGHGYANFMKSQLTNRIAVVAFPNIGGATPQDNDQVLVVTPNGRSYHNRADVLKQHWTLVNPTEAEDLWVAESTLRDDDGEPQAEAVFYAATGCLLPLWDRLPKDRVTVYQMTCDDGERILARILSEDWANTFLMRVNAAQGDAIDPDAALADVLDGEVASLVNGWTIFPHRIRKTGEVMIEVRVHKSEKKSAINEMNACGIHLVERRKISLFGGGEGYFLPRKDSDRAKAWKKLTRFHQVVGVTQFHKKAA